MEPLANISHNENSTAVYFAYINSLLAGAEFEKFCNQTRCTEPVMKLQMVSPTHTHKFPHHKQTPRQSKLPALLTYEVMQCNSQRRKQNNNKKHTNFPFEYLLVNMPKTRTIPQLQRNKKNSIKKWLPGSKKSDAVQQFAAMLLWRLMLLTSRGLLLVAMDHGGEGALGISMTTG